MSDATHTARWCGPFVGHATDGSLIQPGSQHQVTDADLQSGHWQPIAPPASQPAAPSLAQTSPTTLAAADDSADTEEHA